MEQAPIPVEILLVSEESGARALVAMRRVQPTADIPPEALVGTVVMDGTEPQWKSFEMMDRFRSNLAAYMKGELALKPSILNEARVSPGEYVYVIDGRAPDPQGDVAFHEIIGWYTSGPSGRPVANSFEYNTWW